MNFLSSLSAENDLLSLLCWVRVDVHFQPFLSFSLLFSLLAAPSDILTVENRDVSSANNLGLRIIVKSLLHIRNKIGPNIEPWATPALIFIQSTNRIDVNPLMPGGNKKVTYTQINLQLSAADLFKYL